MLGRMSRLFMPTLEVTAVLEMKDVSVHYGKSMALHGVSLRVDQGEAVSIIGANGAGKSTILRALFGLATLSGGEIRFMGNRLDGKKTADIVSMGISLSPEARQLFPYLSVYQNLFLGATLRKDKEGIKKDYEEVYHLFPVLRQRKNQLAGTLSGGEQQMLAIARGLMARPTLLMLDEPSLGLAPVVVKLLFETIQALNDDGVTILLVEQNVHQALEIADYAYVLQTGTLKMEGRAEDLLRDSGFQQAFLGMVV
jgi:branched-chain amino acid transport system ATP-binding protein